MNIADTTVRMAVDFEMFCVDIRAIPKPRMTYKDRNPGTISLAARRYFNYKQELIYRLKNMGMYEKVSSADGFYLNFSLAIPKSSSKKEREKLLDSPHQKRPDLDNLVKGFFDATHREDSTINIMFCRKSWGLTNYINIGCLGKNCMEVYC